MSSLPSLSELFASADQVGRKYQTRLEVEAAEQAQFEADKAVEKAIAKSK